VREVPLMMNDGAVREPMLPRKLAIEDRNCVHVCFSAGGTSARVSGMSGVLSLLDMLWVRVVKVVVVAVVVAVVVVVVVMRRGCAWKGTVHGDDVVVRWFGIKSSGGTGQEAGLIFRF
jgi:hypothetical protein